MSDYYVSENDPATAKIIAERFGFCHVRGVFSPGEMAQFERDLAAAQEEFGADEWQQPDMALIPSLRGLLTDQRVQAFARALLGEQIVYYRETGLRYEKTPGQLTANPFDEYHCDARGSRDFLPESPPNTGRLYPAYRFAIYFRNYRDYSGGLKVAPGSHLRPYEEDRVFSIPAAVGQQPRGRYMIGAMSVKLPLSPMELFNVPSMPGDLVIFSLRTFHSAGAQRFKDRPTFAVLPIVERALKQVEPEHFLPTSPGSRNAIFFDFGAPSEEVDFYIKWRAYERHGKVYAVEDYCRAPADGMLVRNDRIIAGLAVRLLTAVVSGADPGSAPAVRKDAADLLTLAKMHTEYSEYHPLFDRRLLASASSDDPVPVALAIARDISARHKALREAEAERAAKLAAKTAVPA